MSRDGLLILLRRAYVPYQVNVFGDDVLNPHQSEMMMMVKVLLDCSKLEDETHV